MALKWLCYLQVCKFCNRVYLHRQVMLPQLLKTKMKTNYICQELTLTHDIIKEGICHFGGHAFFSVHNFTTKIEAISTCLNKMQHRITSYYLAYGNVPQYVQNRTSLVFSEACFTQETVIKSHGGFFLTFILNVRVKMRVFSRQIFFGTTF